MVFHVVDIYSDITRSTDGFLKKIILKVDLHEVKSRRKAMKTVAMQSGVESVSVKLEPNTLVVVGDIDPVSLAGSLRKLAYVEILKVGPAKPYLPRSPVTYINSETPINHGPDSSIWPKIWQGFVRRLMNKKRLTRSRRENQSSLAISSSSSDPPAASQDLSMEVSMLREELAMAREREGKRELYIVMQYEYLKIMSEKLGLPPPPPPPTGLCDIPASSSSRSRFEILEETSGGLFDTSPDAPTSSSSRSCVEIVEVEESSGGCFDAPPELQTCSSSPRFQIVEENNNFARNES